MRRPLWLCGLVLLPALAFGERTITLAYEDGDSYPWSMKDGTGLDLILLQMTDKALPEVSFNYIQVPWQRCLNNIETGKSEGCFTASFKTARMQHGYYPGTENGGTEPNAALRLHSSSYSLYVLKDSKVDVTGAMTITGLTGKIAAPRGYSIGDDLSKAGYAVDADANKTTNNFQKLISGRVEALAALTLNGDNIMANNPDFAAKVKVLTIPLADKPYYLMFSKQFYAQDKALAEKIWNKAAELRDTQAYKDAASAYLAQ